MKKSVQDVHRFALAVAQLAAERLDPLANADRHAYIIADAAAQGARLVVLPELAATGYVMNAGALWQVAESIGSRGPCLEQWSRSARENSVTVVGGFAERDGDRLYNSAAMVSPTGDIVGVYRKLHLFGGEKQVFSPGDNGLPVVEIDSIRLGVLICYDLRFPEAMRILALQGAQLIAVPTAWVLGFDRRTAADGCIGQVDGALVQANMNQVYVACAGLVGECDGAEFLGRSVIIDPFGQPLGTIGSPTAQELKIAPVDIGEGALARHRGPGIDPLTDRRTDVYGQMLGYDAAQDDR